MNSLLGTCKNGFENIKEIQLFEKLLQNYNF